MYQPVPSTVDFPALEREILDFWDKTRAFEKLVEKNASGPRWSFIDGPITANNPMGVHHAWGRTYKDLYQRYYAMQGYHQRYQNGFDCQGLWVEVEVEKELGFNAKREIEEYGLDRVLREVQGARRAVRRRHLEAVDPPRPVDALGRLATTPTPTTTSSTSGTS